MSPWRLTTAIQLMAGVLLAPDPAWYARRKPAIKAACPGKPLQSEGPLILDLAWATPVKPRLASPARTQALEKKENCRDILSPNMQRMQYSKRAILKGRGAFGTPCFP